jgi:biotin carboxyl carrier protein
VKYFVEINGKELVVDVSGGVARSGGESVRLEDALVPGAFFLRSGGRRLRVLPLPATRGGRRAMLFDGKLVTARVESERDRLRSGPRREGGQQGSVRVTSAIPGIVRQVLRREGDPIAAGDAILTLEAMKMENEIRSEVSGKIRALRVKSGQTVSAGEELALIEPESGRG